MYVKQIEFVLVMLYTSMSANILYNPLGDIYFYIYDASEKTTQHNCSVCNTSIVNIRFLLLPQL